MKVRLNGQMREVPDGVTLDDVVTDLKLERSVIAVEVNRAVVRRGTYAARALEDGDVIEIVTLVGGG